MPRGAAEVSSDERGDSLAEQAAAWVPPWERKQSPAHPESSAELESSGESAGAAELGDTAEQVEMSPRAEVADSPPADLVDAAGSSEVVESDIVEPVDADPDLAGPVDAAEPDRADLVGVAEAEHLEVELPADAGAEPVGVAEPDVAGPLDVADSTAETELAAGTEPPAAEAAADVEPSEVEPVADAEAELVADVEPEPAGEGVEGAESAGGTISTEPEAEGGGDSVLLALAAEGELRGALEAIMLVVEEPVGEIMLAQVLEQPTERITALLTALAEEYSASGRGFELRRAAGGWRLYTRPEYGAYVERFVLDGQQVRLTQAALETLAVIAYKQPVTRSRISAIRGVNCDGVIRTLVSRGLVEECGTEPDSGAYLYRTTMLFLEKLGLNSVDELPSLAPFLPDDVEEIADAAR
jgi:segregation and condensation protein B